MKKWEKPVLSDLSVKLTKNGSENGEENANFVHYCPVCHNCFHNGSDYKKHQELNPECNQKAQINPDLCQGIINPS